MSDTQQDIRDDARLTAYALGELEDRERASVEALIEREPEARALVDEVRATAELLEAELASDGAADAGASLTAAQRNVIEARIASAHAGTRRAGFRILRNRPLVSSVAAALVAVLGFATWRGLAGPESSAPFTYSSFGDVEVASRTRAPSRGLTTMTAMAERQIQARIDPQGVRSPRVILKGTVRKTLAALGYDGGDGEAEGAFEGSFQQEDGAELGYREAYDLITENPFLLASASPLSTFSIDVDTASYSNTRRFLNSGTLPPPSAVRIEELVNYFPYDYAGPTDDAPFAVHVEVGAAPWAPEHRLVRIGLAGREIPRAERKPSNLVFLIDVSGSMNRPHKLPLLVRALTMLVGELDGRDRVAIVVYAGSSGLVLAPTTCDYKEAILQALERLHAGGSTNGGAGIELAYALAEEHFIEGGINRVLLATDGDFNGDFNVGTTDQGSLVELITEKAKSGVFLTVLGFGMGNLNDATLEQLADEGNGHYAYIDSLLEAQKVLVAELGATLETIAKDVKIQVEFNPLEVAGYRLIGYENRLLAAQDFADDSKDAGEIGAGHTVTALYEVVPAGRSLAVPGVDPLRYQTERRPAGAAHSGELLTISLRFKQPDSDASMLISFPVKDSGANFFELSDDTRFAAAVAAFGMVLRSSEYKGTADFEAVREWALGSLGDDVGGYREQFLELVGRAAEIER